MKELREVLNNHWRIVKIFVSIMLVIALWAIAKDTKQKQV